MRATSSASSAGGSSAAVFGVIVHVRRRSPPVSSSARSSSSRYRGLPSALATTSSLTCSPTRPGGTSSSISARAASSRSGASGSSSTRWANRVCASSRKAQPCEPGSGRNAVASITAERSVSASRRSARSRVVRSAQCRSSIASTSGRVAPSASAHSTNASCTRSDSSSAESASSSRSTSCSRRIESIRPRYGRTRSCAAPRSAPARARSLVRTASSVSVSSTPSQVRRSSTNGPYGEPAPYETQRPSSRVTSSPASDRSSASVLVLPSPASPTTSSTCPRPARRSATAPAEPGELALATDQGRARRRLRGGPRADQAGGRHRRGPPLHRHLAERLEHEPFVQARRRPRADRDRTRLGGALQPRGDVRRVAERDRLRVLATHEPDRGGPAVHAHADVEPLDPPGGLDLARVARRRPR